MFLVKSMFIVIKIFVNIFDIKIRDAKGLQMFNKLFEIGIKIQVMSVIFMS